MLTNALRQQLQETQWSDPRNRANTEKQTPRRVLLECMGMIVVANIVNQSPYLMTLTTSQLAPTEGARVTLRHVGSVGAMDHRVNNAWVVKSIEPALLTTGQGTKIQLTR